MMQNNEQICVEILHTTKKNHCYRLISDFEYKINEDLQIMVPKGFTTDFGTSPRLLWCVVAPLDIPKASLIHDYLYCMRGYNAYKMTQKQADDIFFMLLKNDHTCLIALICYYCVRLCGRFYYLNRF